ncbi:putative bifunctional glutamate synthase subunit beta/2-polyprenylphenol hydroxylase [Anaplasma phagocytophilum]|uniref:Bifunctional glutamate synthase subunit beta/2-polyprenylphenol hydroxylase n=1 Tax=Anaplasma phagocytophilum TaxID=948 RepID=A0AA45ZH83_ANAPH|nr:putative bifunctional glutamate synthase subunit beta/2-polyprenylphenol hydroxylase [Anaplasma phagocytophilum]
MYTLLMYLKVLIVGLRPAGIGIAHYLLKEGHNVAAIDGVKINPIIGTSSGIKQTRFYVAQNKTTATINTQ